MEQSELYESPESNSSFLCARHAFQVHQNSMYA